MKLEQSNRIAGLSLGLSDYLNKIVNKLNGVAAGNFGSLDNASTAAPTSGTWAKGDFVTNSNPSELGSAGSKYVVIGFICTASGTPGTWLQCRCLTGN